MKKIAIIFLLTLSLANITDTLWWQSLTKGEQIRILNWIKIQEIRQNINKK